jgi:hypothetical protein
MLTVSAVITAYKIKYWDFRLAKENRNFYPQSQFLHSEQGCCLLSLLACLLILTPIQCLFKNMWSYSVFNIWTDKKEGYWSLFKDNIYSRASLIRNNWDSGMFRLLNFRINRVLQNTRRGVGGGWSFHLVEMIESDSVDAKTEVISHTEVLEAFEHTHCFLCSSTVKPRLQMWFLWSVWINKNFSYDYFFYILFGLTKISD